MDFTDPPRKFAYAALIAFILLAHGITLNNGFVFDDFELIVRNTNLEGAEFWRTLDWNERPVRALTLWLDRVVWGVKPMGFHLTNLLLHGLCVILVFETGRRLLNHGRAAFFGALLFAVHPVLTESVAGITHRKEMLAAAGFLGSFLLIRGSSRRQVLGSTLLYGAGLFAKASAATFPIVLAFWDWLTDRKNLRSISRYLPLILVLAFFVSVKQGALNNYSKKSREGRSFYQRFNPVTIRDASYGNVAVQAILAQGKSVSALIVPAGLSIEHPLPENRNAFSKDGMVGMVSVFLLLFLVIRYRKRRPGVALSAAWAIITPLPTSNLIPVTYFYAERYLYLPYVGYCWLLGAGAAFLVERFGVRTMNRRVATVMAIMVLLAAGSAAAKRSMDWKDNETLMTRTLDVYPKAPNTSFFLGKMRADEGRDDEAILLFQNVLSTHPESPPAHAELGRSLWNLGKADSAISHLERALELRPGWVDVQNDLGVLYCEQGNNDRGLEMFTSSIERDPDNGEARFNLALALMREDRPEEATHHLEAALRLSPTDPSIRPPLGEAYLASNLPEQARDVLLEAVRVDEGDFGSRWRLARAYAALGESAASQRELRILIERPETPAPLREQAAVLIEEAPSQ